MDISWEEQKQQYIESVEAEYTPPEMSYWQHPAPIYRLTGAYKADRPIDGGEPVLFKKTGKEGPVVAVLAVVAALLIYLVGTNEFRSFYVACLLLLLLVVLPVLLTSKTLLRISREGIWLYQGNQDIRWADIVLTYIKEVREEHTHSFLIIHYYDESAAAFRRVEIALEGLGSAAQLAATIEACRTV